MHNNLKSKLEFLFISFFQEKERTSGKQTEPCTTVIGNLINATVTALTVYPKEMVHITKYTQEAGKMTKDM